MSRKRRKRVPRDREKACTIDASSSTFNDIQGSQYNNKSQYTSSQFNDSQYNFNFTISISISKEETTIAILILFFDTRVLGWFERQSPHQERRRGVWRSGSGQFASNYLRRVMIGWDKLCCKNIDTNLALLFMSLPFPCSPLLFRWLGLDLCMCTVFCIL